MAEYRLKCPRCGDEMNNLLQGDTLALMRCPSCGLKVGKEVHHGLQEGQGREREGRQMSGYAESAGPADPVKLFDTSGKLTNKAAVQFAPFSGVPLDPPPKVEQEPLRYQPMPPRRPEWKGERMPKIATDDPWAHRSVGMRCRSCMYFVPKAGEPSAELGALGRCRRHAPTMGGFPAVYEVDWCGDHKLANA